MLISLTAITVIVSVASRIIDKKEAKLLISLVHKKYYAKPEDEREKMNYEADIDEPFDFSGEKNPPLRMYEKKLLSVIIINAVIILACILMFVIPIFKVSMPISDDSEMSISASPLNLALGDSERPLNIDFGGENMSMGALATEDIYESIVATKEIGAYHYSNVKVLEEIRSFAGFMIPFMAVIFVLYSAMAAYNSRSKTKFRCGVDASLLIKGYSLSKIIASAAFYMLYVIPAAFMVAIRYLYCSGNEPKYEFNYEFLIVVFAIVIALEIAKSVIAEDVPQRLAYRASGFVGRGAAKRNSSVNQIAVPQPQTDNENEED